MMKKTLPCTFVLAFCVNAQAQSNVTLYGTLDVGIWHQSKTSGTSPDVNVGRTTSLNTGGIAPSVLGLRGEESLAPDLKAVFNLETHIDPSTGASGLNALWARGANVGLSGSWGTVKLGQQLVPALLGYAATDPRGMRESLAGTQPWALGSAQNLGAGTATPNSTLAFFASNAVSYQFTRGGLYAGVLYALGEAAGHSSPNSVVSMGASYTDGATVSGSYHTSKWASTGADSDRKASLGLGVPLAGGSLKGNFLSTKAYASTGALTGDWRVTGFGGELPVSDRHTLTAAYYHGRNRMSGMGQDKADSMVVSDEYSLSKRTTLYAQLAAIKAGDAAGVVVSILGAQPVQGATTYVLNTGIRHRF